MAYDPNRIRSEERVAIMALGMLAGSFEHHVGNLLKRFERSGYKFVKRDLGLMRSAFTRLRNEALKGVDSETRMHIDRQSRDYEIRAIQVRVTKDPESVIMPLKDEWQFVQIVVESRCKLCLNTGGACKDCGVRKLLKRYVEEPECGMLTECGYQGAILNDSKKMNKQERL